MPKPAPRVRHQRVTNPTKPAAAQEPIAGFSASQFINRAAPDEFNAAVLAEATHFVVNDLAAKVRADAPTLAAARALADAAAGGVARTLIYAVNAAGRAALVEAGGKPLEYVEARI